MQSYVYVVRYPPESAEGLESRLADTAFKRTGQDLGVGAVVVEGDFETEESAISQLGAAFPGLETLDLTFREPTVMNLAGSPDAGALIEAVMGSITPVASGGSPIVVGGAVGDGGQEESKKESEGSKKGSPAPPDTAQKAEPAAGDQKPQVAAPEIGPVAQNIEAGLKAIGIPPELWKTLPDSDRNELAKEVLEDLYKERSAYGRSVRWTFASDAELLGLAPNEDDRGALAMDLLKVRAGIAEHQLAAADEEIELQQQSVAYAAQNVALRMKAVEQQGVVTEILSELLAHFKRWRALSVWGVIFLSVALVFSMFLMVWLFRLARADKISDWALPAGIFALALFVISPAVLLLRERPLEGLDKAGWPGAESSKPQGQTPASSEAAPAATAPAATKPGSTAPVATTSATTNAAQSTNHS
jgi:hypothetical protein